MKKIKNFIFIIFSVLILFSFKEVFADAYDAYRVDDFAFYDPITGGTCNRWNYWTPTNQDNTCYRWIVLVANDNNTKAEITLMLDHDVGYDTYANYKTVLKNETNKWDHFNTNIGGTVSIPSESTIASVMKLGSNRPVVNASTNTTTSIAGIFKDSSGVEHSVNVYTLQINSLYYSKNGKYNSNGYWLTGTGKYSTGGDATGWAYTVTQSSNNNLVDKTKKRGIRPVITVEKNKVEKYVHGSITDVAKAAKEYKYTYDTTKYSKRDENGNVITGSGAGTVTYRQLQGFTVVDSKIIFHSSNNGNPYYGILFYAPTSLQSGAPTKKAKDAKGHSAYDKTGHGNDMTYNTKSKAVALAGPDDYKQIYFYDVSSSATSYLAFKTAKTFPDGAAITSTGAIAYDDYNDKYILSKGRRFYHTKTDLSNLASPYTGLYSFDSSHDLTGQGMEYYKGYLFVAAFNSGSVSKYSLYPDTSHPWSARINVYNAKLKKDGTPDRNYGRLISTLSIDNIKRDGLGGTGEIETISFNKSTGKAYLGYASQEFDSTYMYKFYEFDYSKIVDDAKTSKLARTTKYTEEETGTKVVIDSRDELNAQSLVNSDGDTTWYLVDENDNHKMYRYYKKAYTSYGKRIYDNYGNDEVVTIKDLTTDAQKVTFDDTTIKNTLGSSFKKVATSTGTGKVTYASSNTNVATVSSNGTVNVVGAGSAKITATAAYVKGKYYKGTASYSLSVAKGDQTLTFDVSTLSKVYGSAQYTKAASHTKGDGAVTYKSDNTSVATVDSNGKVTIKGAGTAKITATAAATTNYKSATASYTLTVTQANQTISFSESSVSKTYGEADFTIAASHTVGDGAVTYASNKTSVATVDANGKVTIKGVGTAKITATAAATTNYKAASATYTLVVSKKNQSLSFLRSNVSTTYSDTYTYKNTVTALVVAPDTTITYSSSNTDIATVNASTGVVTMKKAGVVTITATAAATSEYNAATASYKLTINKAKRNLVINDGESLTLKYGQIGEATVKRIMDGDTSTRTVLCTTELCGNLSFNSSNQSIITVDSSGNITTKGVGNAVIVVIAPGDDKYEEETVELPVTVKKGDRSISHTPSSVNVLLDDHTYNSSFIVTSAGGDNISYTSSNTAVATVNNEGLVTLKAIGDTVITASSVNDPHYVDMSASYTLHVDDVDAYIYFTVDNVNKTYGAGKFTISPTIKVTDTASFTSSDTGVATINSTTGEVTIVGAGDTTITAELTETSASASYTLHVEKANSVIELGEEQVTKIYGAEPFSVNVVNKIGDGVVSYESSDTSVATVSSTGEVSIVGIGDTTITATVAATSNYKTANDSYTLTISKKSQSISYDVERVDKKYGDGDFTITLNHDNAVGTITYQSSNTAVATVDSTGKVTIVGVGDTEITATAAGDAYTEQATASYLLEVEKLDQEISFSDEEIEKDYDDEDFIITANRTVGDGAITYSSSKTGVAKVNKTTGEATIIGAGETVITAKAAATTVYKEARASYTLIVSGEGQIVTFDSSEVSKKYGDEDFTNPASSTGDGELIYESENEDIAIVDSETGVVTITGVGTVEIYAIAEETDLYEEAEASYTLIVEKGDQVISFAKSEENKKYTDGSFTLSATLEKGNGEISYSSNHADIAIVDNNGQVTINGVGTVEITATAVETDEYNEASTKYTLVIGKGDQTVAFASDTVSKTFGDDKFTNGFSHSVGDGEITYSSSNAQVAIVDENTGEVTIAGGGEAVIKATAAATSNFKGTETTYTLTVAKADQVIGFDVESVTKRKGDTYTLAVTQSVGTGDISYGSSDSRVAEVDPFGTVTVKKEGAVTIRAVAAANTDYNKASASYELYVFGEGVKVAFASSEVELEYGTDEFAMPAVAMEDGATITYLSSDTSIATVDSAGRVTIHGAGEVTITATVNPDSTDPADSASYTLRIAKLDRNVSFEENNINKTYGDEEFRIQVHKTGDGNVTYTSSNNDIATVDNTGKVTILRAGEVTITATVEETANYNSGEASYLLTIEKAEQEISFADTSVSKPFNEEDFTYAVTQTVGDGEITYTSSDTDVAIVDNTGKVHIKKRGTTTITATAASNDKYLSTSASYSLNAVQAPQVLDFDDSSVTLTYGEQETIKINIVRGVEDDGEDADASGDEDITTSDEDTITIEEEVMEINLMRGAGDGEITLTSSDNDIATIDEEGLITILKAGEVTITATAAATDDYDETSASFSLIIRKADQELVVPVTEIKKKVGDGKFTIDIDDEDLIGDLEISIEDEEIAKIDEENYIHILKAGQTNIIVKATETDNYKEKTVLIKLVVEGDKESDPDTKDDTIVENVPSENTVANISFIVIMVTLLLIGTGSAIIYKKRFS